jgi:hypothetical protein
LAGRSIPEALLASGEGTAGPPNTPLGPGAPGALARGARLRPSGELTEPDDERGACIAAEVEPVVRPEVEGMLGAGAGGKNEVRCSSLGGGSFFAIGVCAKRPLGIVALVGPMRVLCAGAAAALGGAANGAAGRAAGAADAVANGAGGGTGDGGGLPATGAGLGAAEGTGIGARSGARMLVLGAGGSSEARASSAPSV